MVSRWAELLSAAPSRHARHAATARDRGFGAGADHPEGVVASLAPTADAARHRQDGPCIRTAMTAARWLPFRPAVQRLDHRSGTAAPSTSRKPGRPVRVERVDLATSARPRAIAPGAWDRSRPSTSPTGLTTARGSSQLHHSTLNVVRGEGRASSARRSAEAHTQPEDCMDVEAGRHGRKRGSTKKKAAREGREEALSGPRARAAVLCLRPAHAFRGSARSGASRSLPDSASFVYPRLRGSVASPAWMNDSSRSRLVGL